MTDVSRSAARQLILYATPTGPLARMCKDYFERLVDSPTTAQAYPPHCTLSGFFRRCDGRAGQIIERTKSILTSAGPVPDSAVQIVGLRTSDEWVGLELRSPWLRALAAEVEAADEPMPDEDGLRLKDWLHLSLAYGVEDLSPYGRRAKDMIDPTAACGWEVALWERHLDDRWSRL